MGSRSIEKLEARSARIVLNPAKAPLRPRPPDPKKKITLPDVFPERVHLVDATLIVRNRPYDFVMEHVDLDLDPRNPGQLKIKKLQLVGGQMWLNVAAQTSYANRILILREVALSNDERIRELRVDASRIAERKLAISLDYSVGAGTLSGSFALNEAQSSLNTDLRLRAENVPLGVINKYAALPEDFIRGHIEKLDVDLGGLISSPRTWQGKLIAQISNFQQRGTTFDRGIFQISAANGTAVLQTGDILQGENESHLRGTVELPARFKDFGRTPTHLEVAGTAADLQQLTAGTPLRLTGSAQFTGKIDIVNAKVEANLGVTASSVGFPEGTIDKMSATLRVSKFVPPADSKKPWFADLRTATEIGLTNIRYREYLVDSVNGSLSGLDDVLGLDRVIVRRNQNELNVRGRYWLPADPGKASSQPAELDVALNAPEVGDFWAVDSPNKVSGPLQMTAQLEWKQEVANGNVSISGSNLRIRDLVFRQLSTQWSVSNNVVYVKEGSAILNDSDFINATGSLNLRPPYHYNGKVFARVANLSTLEPLLRASGNENELAGSFALDWEGNGDAQIVKNSGS